MQTQFREKLKRKAHSVLQWLRGKVSYPKATASLIALNVFFGAALLIFPAQPGPLSVSAQGKILQLGDVSIHPITVDITNKPNTHTPALCLVYVGVQIERRFWDGEFYLTSGPHIYPATDILPIGQDAFFGQKQTRVFAFHPEELCKRGPVRAEDLSLLLVHPNGIGTISLAGLEH